MLKLPNKGCWC